jgi:NAD(P)-dependent dehydrogenase (short-subunit alcohol dehydrogenase family)
VNGDLAGRVVVVTGGTSGIGREVVAKLSSCGAHVFFQGRNASAAREIIAAATEAKPVFVPGELSDYGSIQQLCEVAVQHHGRLDGAVGSGVPSRAYGMSSLFHEADASRFIEFFQNGTVPRAYLAHAAAQYMIPKGYGKIVLLTTDAGRVPTPAESMIGSAAAAVMFLTRSIGKELARSGVRVNTVSISLTMDTPAYERLSGLRESGQEGVLERMFDRIEQRSPFGLSTPQEVAEVVCFMLRSESDGITGSTLSLNRGSHFPVYA